MKNENTNTLVKLSLSFASISWFSRSSIEGDVKSYSLSYRCPCRGRWLEKLTSGRKNLQPFFHIWVNKLEWIFLCWSPQEGASVWFGPTWETALVITDGRCVCGPRVRCRVADTSVGTVLTLSAAVRCIHLLKWCYYCRDNQYGNQSVITRQSSVVPLNFKWWEEEGWAYLKMGFV